MSRNPWDLSPEQMHKLVIVGIEPDEIESIQESRKESYNMMLEEVYGDDPVETSEEHFYDKYGFEHICHCVDDLFTDNTVRIPRCRYKMGDDALDALEARNIERDELVEQVDTLRRQVAELGETPIA